MNKEQRQFNTVLDINLNKIKLNNSMETTGTLTISRDQLDRLERVSNKRARDILNEIMYGNVTKIETFEKACEVLGKDNDLVAGFSSMSQAINDAKIIAMLKLQIITKALNNGWKALPLKDRFFPVFEIWMKDEIPMHLGIKEGSKDWKRRVRSLDDCVIGNDNAVYKIEKPCLVFAGVEITASKYIRGGAWRFCTSSPTLCYEHENVAEYAGYQFIDLWKDFFIPQE